MTKAWLQLDKTKEEKRSEARFRAICCSLALQFLRSFKREKYHIVFCGLEAVMLVSIEISPLAAKLTGDACK